MALSDDIYKTMTRLVLDHCRVEYQELADTWHSLERKAQGTTAIAGSFLSFPAKNDGVSEILSTWSGPARLLCNKRNGTLHRGMTSDLIKCVYEHKKSENFL